jgi:hypothetical protein
LSPSHTPYRFPQAHGSPRATTGIVYCRTVTRTSYGDVGGTRRATYRRRTSINGRTLRPSGSLILRWDFPYPSYSPPAAPGGVGEGVRATLIVRVFRNTPTQPPPLLRGRSKTKGNMSLTRLIIPPAARECMHKSPKATVMLARTCDPQRYQPQRTDPSRII